MNWHEFDEEKCDAQGLLFVYASEEGYDMADFTQKFLTSDFCHREWDAIHSYYQFADATLSMDRLQKECTFKKRTDLSGGSGLLDRLYVSVSSADL